MPFEYNGRRVTIQHATPCGCVIDGDAIYVREPCTVIGNHVTKRRIKQLLFALRHPEKKED